MAFKTGDYGLKQKGGFKPFKSQFWAENVNSSSEIYIKLQIYLKWLYIKRDLTALCLGKNVNYLVIDYIVWPKSLS